MGGGSKAAETPAVSGSGVAVATGSSSSAGGSSSSGGMQQSVGSGDAGVQSSAGMSSPNGNLNSNSSKIGTTTGSGIANGNGSLSNVDGLDGGKSGRGEENVAEFNSMEILREAEIEKILSSTMLLKQLQMIERAVQQNANHRSQLDYRDLPDIAPLSLVKQKGVTSQDTGGLFGGLGGGKGNTSTSKAAPSSSSVADLLKRGPGMAASSGGSVGEKKGDDDDHSARTGLGGPEYSDSKVKKLFSYSNRSLTHGRSVTAMVWNSASHDLLAVGYGKIDAVDDAHRAGEALDEEKQGGLVLFWSLRNPDFPEKILRTNHPVSALDFSKLNPMILGVGLLNGDVNIYDVKREGANWSIPIETSAKMENGHTDPVWQLQWVIKGTERLETLVSISTDGSVLEWNIKKGLLVSSLMQLKKNGMGEGWISNTSAGLCLDFNPADPSTYVAGTEDGSIHRCSVSYNEQYLETYKGHDGPVQRLKFSQRWPSVFLSCSVDWSMNLYHLRSKVPLLSMRATGEDFAISDICWCPDNSTVFACVTVDAKLQVWDLSVSSIDPVVTVDCALDDDREVEKPHTTGTAGEGIDTEFDDLLEGDSLEGTRDHGTTTINRFDRLDFTSGAKEPEDQAPPVAKLLRNLAQDSKKKVLTALQFGSKTPIIVVGDSQGTVTVYRIFDPITITHQGPLQQATKLQRAVVQQTDPENVAMLATFSHEGGALEATAPME